MDPFGFEQLAAWLTHRVLLPLGPLFCVINGATRGRRWSATAARAELRELAVDAGVRRRFAAHQLRHAHAVELAREGIAVNIIQRQLGPTDLGTTRRTCRGSIRARSSTPSVPADRPPSPPLPDSSSKNIYALRAPPAKRAGRSYAASALAATQLDVAASTAPLVRRQCGIEWGARMVPESRAG